MKFNPNNYKNKTVMHCKTQAELNDFIEYLKANGYTDMIPPHNHKCYYGENVYYFNVSSYWSSIKYAKDNDYTILEWSDFMNDTFMKEDLKTGDVILRRNGSVEIVNCELGMLILQNGGWNDFDDISKDLTSANDEKYDIVAVRRPIDKADCSFVAFSHKWGTLVYERPEVEEMTLAQVCKLLGKNIKIIQ